MKEPKTWVPDGIEAEDVADCLSGTLLPNPEWQTEAAALVRALEAVRVAADGIPDLLDDYVQMIEANVEMASMNYGRSVSIELREALAAVDRIRQ